MLHKNAEKCADSQNCFSQIRTGKYFWGFMSKLETSLLVSLVTLIMLRKAIDFDGKLSSLTGYWLHLENSNWFMQEERGRE